MRKEAGIEVHWKCKAYTDNFLLQDKILNLEKLYPQVDFNCYYTCFYQMVGVKWIFVSEGSAPLCSVNKTHRQPRNALKIHVLLDF